MNKNDRDNKNINNKAFRLLGITEVEFSVYRALLMSGASSAHVAAKNAHLNERSTYDCIERLIGKGLVGQILQNNKRMFLALNPEMLSYVIDEQENHVHEDFKELQIMLESSQDKLTINQIPSKKAFLKLVKDMPIDTILLGKDSENILTFSSFKLLLHVQKPSIKKITYSDAKIVVMFSKELFLIYSITEEKGFYIIDSNFAKNMRVYFQ